MGRLRRKLLGVDAGGFRHFQEEIRARLQTLEGKNPQIEDVLRRETERLHELESLKARLAAIERRLETGKRLASAARLNDWHASVANIQDTLANLVTRLGVLEERISSTNPRSAKIESQIFLLEQLLTDHLTGCAESKTSLEDQHAPSVSIIMPTRNRAKWLAEAIESVRSQRYTDWELIVVDDGSTDDTESVMQAFSNDRRIRYRRLPAAGAAGARNAGLKLARGAFVAYLDSDNLFFPDFLSRALKEFRADPTLDLIYGVLVTEHHYGLTNTRLLWEPFDRSRLLKANFIDINVVVHRRSLFEIHGGFDESLARLMDWDLLLRYSDVARVKPLPVLATRYRRVDQQRITDSEPLRAAFFRVTRKWQSGSPGAAIPRVLYVLWHYPQLSETYIETEIRCMLRWGVHVEVWAETDVASPYPASVPVHRGSLQEAIAKVRPDLLHVHWLSFALAKRSDIETCDLPVTMKVHGFEFTPETLRQISDWRQVRAIYGFPHHVSAAGASDARMKMIQSAFDTELFKPHRAKDRHLVVRTSAGLPSKDLTLFFELAKKLPKHRFVLAAVTCKDRESCIEELREAWMRSGTPAELKIDLPREEIVPLVSRAGIYVHTARIHGEENATPIGAPVSIAEAMATGAHVLVRDVEPLKAYVGEAGTPYRDLEHAAAIIQETDSWSEAEWSEAWKRSVDRAFGLHADELALRPILDDWLGLLASRAERSEERELAPQGA